MTLIVDASVAVKWFFAESGHIRARSILDRGDTLIAPSLVLAEIASAVWKRFRRGEIAREAAGRVIGVMGLPFTEIVPIERLVEEAASLSIDLDHPIYDCFYVVLARSQRAAVATADRKMLSLAQRASVTSELIDE